MIIVIVIIPTQSEKELQVSLFQSLVLLLYNNDDKLTYSDIKHATNIGTVTVVYTVEPRYSKPLNYSHLAIAANSSNTHGLIE